MNRAISFAAFLLGLFVIGWVGAGYVGTSPLALLMTGAIGVTFVAGGAELWRFHAATGGLARALASVPAEPGGLGDWLAGLHPSLQGAVRLRIEGERAGLPAPALTPYLVGLLVLLGMLGTFLGMVVTLNGAVIALEGSTDLHTIRSALSAPVKGLGVAFGTSVAGVAASAMLGLISALCRRARMDVSRQLDARIATSLRAFSFAHRRDETFNALQVQARLLPEVAERLQAMMAQVERHGETLGAQLVASQQAHYREAKGLFADLAASVDASLKASLADSARQAGETIRPAVEAAMAGIARETTQLHERVAATVDAQLGAIASRFDASVSAVSDTWTAALARHDDTSRAAAAGLQDALAAFTTRFDERAGALLSGVERSQQAAQAELATTLATVTAETRALHQHLAASVSTQLDGLAKRFGDAVGTVTEGWMAALARHDDTSRAAAAGLQDALAAFTTRFDERAGALLSGVERSQQVAQAELATTLASVTAETRALHQQLAASVSTQLDGLAERFGDAVGTVTEGWTAALARHDDTSRAAAAGLQDALAAFTTRFDERAGALLSGVERSQQAAQAELATTLASVTAETRALHQHLAASVSTQLDGLAERFGGAVGTVTEGWRAALAGQARTAEALAVDTRSALAAFADTFDQRAAALVDNVRQAHVALQADAAGRDDARLAATSAAIEAMVATLRGEWQAAGARAVAQQDALCTTFEATARRVADAAEAQAARTIDEVAGLMAQVAEAPRAAAEVVGALRSELSASIARDNTMLAERSRIMETLSALLDAINHASTEQRGAIDALVSTSAEMLERVGARFEARVGSEAARMTDIADRITGGAIEVASLGEAFGAAVQGFGDASGRLLETLQRIEGALEKAATRSDEQLAYYVAQAREVIDLSILSQKQIVEDLQRLAVRQAAGGEA